MKRLIVILLSVILPLAAGAQSLSVESFRLLENDLTANTYGTTERDQNGEVAALIKIVTSETGFAFDAGMLGIVKTVQKTGEIWVYVPYGLQRMTIAHQEFGVLRDYYFPIPIEKARTYELRLNTPPRKGEDKKEALKSLTVTLSSPMKTANLYVDGNQLGTGSLKVKLLALTEYKVEVKLNGYHTFSTTIRLEPHEDGKVIEFPPLVPITGTLKISSQPEGAYIYIGEVYAGKTPLLKENVALGTKVLDFRMKDHHSYRTMVNVTEEKTYEVNAILREIKYLGKNNFYFGAAYHTGNMAAIAGYVGFYTHNINIEGSYLMPKIEPQKASWITSPEAWKGSSVQLVYNYTPATVFGGSLGVGIHLGKRCRFTPQAGVMYYGLKGDLLTEESSLSQISVKESDRKVSTWVMSARGAMRVELCPFNHVTLAISPGYEMPVKMGSHAAKMNESSDLIKKWCGGISVRAGLELYF